jgi:hypothetical protein
MNDPRPEPPKKVDTTDYKERSRKNLIAGVALTAMLAFFIYAAKLFYEHEKMQNCIDSGRRNCVDFGSVPREGVFIPPSQRRD